jgi:hypothetical protein
MKRLQFALAGAMLFAWACAAQAQSAGGPMNSPYANPQMMMGSPYANPQMMGSPYANPYGQPANYTVGQASYPQSDPAQGMLYGPSAGGPMPMGGPDGGGCPCGCMPPGAECSDDGAVHYGYFNAEGFYARRQTQRVTNQPLFLDFGATVVDTKSLDFIYEPGIKATVGYYFEKGFGMEGTYFGQFDFRRGIFASDPDSGLSLPGNLGTLSEDFTAVPNLSAVYRSQIQNGELNFILPYGSVQFLTGFRYMQVEEFLDISGGINGVETSDYATHTMNNLYGGQFGARGQWTIWRLTFDAQCKAGLYENFANTQQTIGDFANSVSYRDTSAQRDSTAFVGEVGAELTFPLTSWLTLRGGYMAVWIEQVALAPGQLNFDAGPGFTDPTAGVTVNNHSGILLHGFTAGLEARW